MAGASQPAGGPFEPTPGSSRLGVAACCLAALLALSNQSFWIDEALTGLKAAQPSLADGWRQMSTEKHSDLQMPLYMLYVWGWAKLFGTAEWVLRAANLPWFIGGVFSFAVSFRGPVRLAAAGISVLSAFAWFYLDEARPYAMQLGASLFIVAALRQLLPATGWNERRNAWVRAFCVGMGVLAGTSLLASFWCAAVIVAMLAMLPASRVIGLLRAARVAWLLLAAWLVCLGTYYAWTVSIGARASAAGGTNFQNAFFIAYELLGFSGLGPGRLEIRGTGLAAFRTHLPALAAYGGFAGAVLAMGVARLWREERQTLVIVGGVVAGTLVVLLGAGWALHFRLLGRHCAPAFVAVALLFVAGADQAWQHRGRWRKALIFGFLLVALASCLSARWARRHHKDDYRAAAAFARQALADGHCVWWSADRSGAEFYGLPVSEAVEGMPATAWGIVNASAESLTSTPVPDFIVASKPDLYDSQGALTAHLARERFELVSELTAFRIWKRRR